jgi:hypothetical protein
MDNSTSRPGRRWFRRHVASAFVLGLTSVVAGASVPGHGGGTVSAQELNPCGLLTEDEIKPLAEKTSVAAGMSNSLPSAGYASCRYAWGDGVDRFKLVVVVTDASRMFPGMAPDQIKQRLLQSVRVGTDDAVVAELGDAALFKPDSYVYATATALVKGRILQVQLDGVGALDKKDQVIGLLKSAALRL